MNIGAAFAILAAMITSSVHAEVKSTISGEELNGNAARAAQILIGKQPENVVGRFFNLALPAPFISGIVFVLQPRQAEQNAICITHEITVPLAIEIEPPVIVNGKKLPDVDAPSVKYKRVGELVDEVRYFRLATDKGCSVMPVNRNDLFTASDAFVAVRGLRLLDQAVATVHRQTNLKNVFRCVMNEKPCDASNVFENYKYDIESIKFCPDAPCLVVDQSFDWGGAAVVIRVFGKEKLDHVEVEHVIRPVV